MSNERALAWGASVSERFRTLVAGIADRLSIDPSWLMACMAFETGRTFSPSIRNRISGATGLIQFMPSTARRLGITVDELAGMSAEEQLTYVDGYFGPYGGHIDSLADCYMVILWPAAVGKPDDYVLAAEGGAAYFQNKGLDLNQDGRITKAEAAAKVAALLTEGLQPEHATPLEASIEDDSMPADAATRAAATVPPEPFAMPDRQEPSFLDAALPILTTVATAINPIAGALIAAFSPLAREKIAGLVNKHTSNPEVGNQVASAVITAAQAITQQKDPLEAVIAARSDPAVLARVEADALGRVDKLIPLFDRLFEVDKGRWAAGESSADAAAKRVPAYGKRLADLVAKFALTTGGLVTVALLAGMLGELFIRGTIDVALIAMAGPVLTMAMRDANSVVRAVFGGPVESDAAPALRDATKAAAK